MAYINGNRILNVQLHGGVGGDITVDDIMSDASTNPVQNKVIKNYIDTAAADLDVNIAALDTRLSAVEMNTQIIFADLVNYIKYEDVVQSFGIADEMPISSAAVVQAYTALEGAITRSVSESETKTKSYIDGKTSWKTLINQTLTAEQGGTDSLMIAINDVEALVNARQIRVAVSFPVAEAKAASDFWHSIIVADADKRYYNCYFLAGYNAKGGANVTYFATADIKVFNFRFSSGFTRSYHSLEQLPNIHYNAAANSNVNAKEITGGFNVGAIEDYPPYLHITNTAGVTFEKGTHIFMEVQ